MSQIIIPKYRDESPSFQRASDWLFGSKDGYEKYMEEEKRKMLAELAEIGREAQSANVKNVNGIGQHTMQVSIADYMRWEIMYPGIWNDKSFVDEYKRDNPYCRVARPEQKTFTVGAVTA